eukprot:365479-Chlamydomonas_euryale.AAC.17
MHRLIAALRKNKDITFFEILVARYGPYPSSDCPDRVEVRYGPAAGLVPRVRRGRQGWCVLRCNAEGRLSETHYRCDRCDQNKSQLAAVQMLSIVENARVALAPKDARDWCFRKGADGKYVCSCTRTSLVMEVTKRHPAKAPWGSEWMVVHACMHACACASTHAGALRGQP